MLSLMRLSSQVFQPVTPIRKALSADRAEDWHTHVTHLFDQTVRWWQCLEYTGIQDRETPILRYTTASDSTIYIGCIPIVDMMWATQDLFRAPACAWLIELFPLLDGLATVLSLPSSNTQALFNDRAFFNAHTLFMRARSSMGIQQRLVITPLPLV